MTNRPGGSLMSAVPDRTVQQRQAALEIANEIRTHRARMKRDLAAGRIEFAEVLDDPRCATMKAWDALIALPKWGRVKVNRALAMHTISPSKTLGGLTERQRHALLEQLS